MYKDVKGVNEMNQKRWIGIDGGGTKTTCVIGDQHGQLLGSSVGTSSNIQSKPVAEVKEVLLGLIHEALSKSDTTLEQLETVYLGLAGGDRPEDKRRVLEMLQSIVRQNVRVIVENDAMAALASGTWGQQGLVLIAGTGSIAYAYPSFTKDLIRAGGWGYLLGDEGSGYDIGRGGLTAVLRQFDGRGPKTLMTGMLIDKMGISNPAEIVTAVYGRSDTRSRIADLSKVVFQAAKQKDAIALELIDKAIEQLIELVETVQERITQQTDLFPLVISGGLFQDEFFKERFDREVHRRLNQLTPIYPSIPPVVGAYILALKHSEGTITEKIKSRIENSWAKMSN